MEWVEMTGRTVEEAKDAALDQLGVDEQDAEFEVLEEPRTGLFGRLRNEARVRARVQPTTPRSKDDRRDRKRGRDRQEGRPAGDRGDAKPRNTTKAAESKPVRASRAETPKRQVASSASGARSDGGVAVSDMTLVEQGEVAREFLQGLVDVLGATDASVTTSEVDADTVEVNIDGGDLGLLIGPKGQTLAALQELTRTVVQRRTGGREGWLLVDVSGYRKKRREALARFARQVAAQVQSTGTAVSMEPMSAADRKAVHDTINDIDGVATTSEGEDPRRRVVVRPS